MARSGEGDGSYVFTADASVIGTGAASATFTDDGQANGDRTISFTITDANKPSGGTSAARWTRWLRSAGGNRRARVMTSSHTATMRRTPARDLHRVLTTTWRHGAGTISFAALHGTSGRLHRTVTMVERGGGRWHAAGDGTARRASSRGDADSGRTSDVADNVLACRGPNEEKRPIHDVAI